MNYSKIALRYSKALLLLSKEKGLLDVIKDDMLLIQKVYKETEDFRRLLESKIIQTSQKQKILASIFRGKVNDLTISFINLVAKNNREIFISDITRNFIDLYRKEKGIKAVTLTTAINIDDKIKNDIISIIKQIYNAKVDLTSITNKDIIGGFVLQVDDKQLDASVSNKLKEINREFINTTFEYKILG